MRAWTASLALAGVVALALAVVAAGRTIDGATPGLTPGNGETFGPPIPVDLAPPEPSLHVASQPARSVDPALVAPPPVDRDTLVRVGPRDPLGPLGQAQQPRKKEREGGPLLFNPVATASATFEAMSYTVAIAGTESVDPAETCTYDGAEWPCGTRALAAVRLWLRGRALACDIPPDTDPELVVVACRLGNLDVGAWLVANGWARATKDGRYAEDEAKAREAGLGIFGAPPPALPPPAPPPATSDLGPVEE